MPDATTPETGSPSDEEIALFGDPRSAQVVRGPDRRRGDHDGDRPLFDAAHAPNHLDIVRGEGDHHVIISRAAGPGRALRLGRGDGFAATLTILGVVLFVASVVSGALILYNAQDVGAFSDPLNSNRVAIGFAVLGVGIALSALLVGLGRAITYLLATLRLRLHELDQASATQHTTNHT